MSSMQSSAITSEMCFLCVFMCLVVQFFFSPEVFFWCDLSIVWLLDIKLYWMLHEFSRCVANTGYFAFNSFCNYLWNVECLNGYCRCRILFKIEYYCIDEDIDRSWIVKKNLGTLNFFFPIHLALQIQQITTQMLIAFQ